MTDRPKKAKGRDSRAETPAPLGRVTGFSGLLWAVLVDAASAPAWDDADEPKAFRMVEKRAAKPVVGVGGARGVVAEISNAGSAEIWGHRHGVVLCDFFPSDDVDVRKPAGLRKIARHVLAAPTVGKPRRLGEITIKSGVLAILVPNGPPDLPASLVARAKKAKKAIAREGFTLVALPPGVYEVVTESLGEYEVEEGLFAARLWIVRKGTYAATAGPPKAAKKKPAPKKPAVVDPYAYRRTSLARTSISLLFVRDGKKGAKDFVLLVRHNQKRQLIVETGRWGEEGTRTEKTFASKAALQKAFWVERDAMDRKRYRLIEFAADRERLDAA